MFKKILIANRGEIACRVAATARRMAIQTVAVYSDADADAKHVRACDEAVHIGGSAPKDSYLRWERIIEAAKATGAQAIHPGYGFLSENEEFAQACADAGLVFIGPPPSAIKAMGLKAESKQLMEKAGVPLVPGYHGTDQDATMLKHEADRIGYPVLIKASAGGGGKGMRAVERAEDFAAALASCQREAINSFGDDAVLIEKYVQRPRHIEIQVFGDSHGNYVYLFERDCSVQRRHQKVLEEAPAPGMTAEMRQQMGLAAVAAARAVNYVGAGTVEFIVEQREEVPASAKRSAAGPSQGGAAPSGGSEDTLVPSVGAMSFFFMEMNTRLQVEHPVTEAITGQDLVAWQLQVASGEKLPLSQEQLKITGHAIEARICAENPDNNFLPATGSLQVYALPDCTMFEYGAVRVDSGVREGDTISPYYDSMVAKLIVHGATREEALARLDMALTQTRIVGLTTNVQFLRHVLQSRSFAQAELDTALIPREEAVLFRQERVGLPLAAASVVAHTLQQEQAVQQAQTGASGWLDPWARRDDWRAYGVSMRRFEFEFHGEPHAATLTCLHDGALQLAVDDVAGGLTWSPVGEALDVQFGGRRELVHVHRQGELAHVFARAGATQIVVIDALAHAGDSQSEGGRLTAPMPGKVVSFAVKAGDKVSKGQALAVMEAMKMEHTIAAPADGVVAELLYAPGDQVNEGAELLKLSA
ncbi:MAG: acetyl/propionyl/methylcrotonyl-CoA carboxylase subunit alpha [Gammaproteobacteria bacterium]|nr:acetyl/propionyl/methylcrotonyl-CoA carboxylase subunit alpha [Gammaproteobacteria bacterium]MBU0786743.1 acetyl/propionyl/methylcrotonyl-CoA carboxylase subunit alpha [Gammaproteobacteria bacterium]MBU0814051.1 acetyl/propionyl/methylcrotonyl-CoA carboxylase subunit alpha [Gammaproteobacteria bacterium]MBU1788476.1 acetyl/propionyl/methylcrotonyl-CoA carboxylase subunit alpha [Gammaproteobacteria bacterium]